MIRYDGGFSMVMLLCWKVDDIFSHRSKVLPRHSKAATWSSRVGRDVGLARGTLERVEPLGFSGALIRRPAIFWG